MLKFFRYICLSSLLLLSACQVVLFTDYSEPDVNAMLGLLLDHGVSASKATGSKATLANLMVDSAQISQAIDILNSHGYPKTTYDSLGTLFAKQGLVSSPTEERVRFIYGISQELEETISQIDGVISARVHIVIPDSNPTSQVSEPSSAAVMIKFNRAYDLDSQVPQLKLLVTNAVQGLTYERVSVVLFPALETKYGKTAETYKPTAAGANSASFYFKRSYLSSIITGALVVMVVGFIYYQMTRRKASVNANEEDDFSI